MYQNISRIFMFHEQLGLMQKLCDIKSVYYIPLVTCSKMFCCMYNENTGE